MVPTTVASEPIGPRRSHFLNNAISRSARWRIWPVHPLLLMPQARFHHRAIKAIKISVQK